MKEAISFLKNILKENDSVVLALSGGPDSMCLLHLLLEVKKEINISILCAHVNHNTRKNNQKEESFVKNYLEEISVPCEYYTIEKYKNGKFTEEEGREKRYQFLKKVVKSHHANYLLTAHHGDDLVETIFMRILRGSTLKGYAGIERQSIWDDVNIIRPLLCVSKKDILDYVTCQSIPYVLDETNNSDNYLRNRIRHNILPFLMKEDGDYVKKFLKFSNTLLESDQYIHSKLDKEQLIEKNKIKKEEFLNCFSFEQKEILKIYFKENYDQDLKVLTDKHLNLAMSFILNPKSTDCMNFPKKKELKKNKKYIWLQDKKEKVEYKIELQDDVILPNGNQVKKLNHYEMKSNYEIHLNSKDVVLPLYLMTRQNGMKMEVKNLKGSKKVKDILIDSHIDTDEKDEIPILVDASGTVLWVLGIKKSKYDLEKSENYDIIYKYIKKEG